MVRLTLPDDLTLLQSGTPFLDVLGPQGPWEVPEGWWDTVRTGVRQIADTELTPVRDTWDSYRDATRASVHFAFLMAQGLAGWNPVFTGTCARFPWLVVDEYLKPGKQLKPNSTYRYRGERSDWPTWLFSWAGDNAERREQALEASIRTLRLFDDVPPLADRRDVVLSLYEDISSDPALRRLHMEGDYNHEIVGHWRNRLDPAVYSVIPELGGWIDALAWSFEGIQAAHRAMESVISRPLPMHEVLAIFLLAGGHEGVPALLTTVVGLDLSNEISKALERLRPGFDVLENEARIREWVARGLLAGEIHLCRTWMTLANDLSCGIAGMPDAPRFVKGVHLMGFVEDIEEMYTVRVTRNPYAATIAARTNPTLTEDEPNPAQKPVAVSLTSGSSDRMTAHTSP